MASYLRHRNFITGSTLPQLIWLTFSCGTETLLFTKLYNGRAKESLFGIMDDLIKVVKAGKETGFNLLIYIRFVFYPYVGS